MDSASTTKSVGEGYVGIMYSDLKSGLEIGGARALTSLLSASSTRIAV